ncbi:major facilitator superfamily domain-containing protein 6-A-like [Actinia tenebrosa]|uniref:Major facilitator superfamily domain-containing protein 6-A-like n=1 Tax=Actinia tenebrosa TaxID=6105 RepID=A0A6P8IMY8_ACTTE|nr:major facilitator superfamily domain-containing protein 6-A-like [Actinia tenebrosa]
MIPSSYKPIESDSPPRTSENTTSRAHDQQSVHKRLLGKVKEIDRSFVVSKLFYFFFYTALGALFPFFSLYYKQLWLTPSQIGILLALRPTVKLICLPLWKIITEKYSRPKAVYFISIFGWLIGYYGQTLVYTSDTPCYGINVNQTAFSTPFASVNSTNLSDHLNASLIKKREWELRNTELQSQPEHYLNENRVRRSVYDEIIVDEIGNVPFKRRISKESRRIVGSPEESQVNDQATPRNILYTDKNILRTNKLSDNTRHDYTRKIKANGLDKEDLRQEGHGSIENENFVEKDSYKHSNLETTGIVAPGLNNEDKNKDISSNKFVKEEKIDQQSAFLKEDINDDNSQPLIELISKQKHLGAFQNGNISKSPKPADDFRVRYNFWILRTLIVIVILTEIITSPTPMIADSAVIQSLAGSNSDYGRQRLFGFFGLGLAAILVAVWVSYSSFCHYTNTINYLPCFYIFLIAIGATVFVSLFFDFQSAETNGNEVKLLETLKIFKLPRYGFFLFTIFFTGFAHSLQISFLFWFLQDIGGTPTLFAIIILIHSVSEVVMYFLAPYLDKGVGHQGTICIALACYTARFLMYGSLKHPWLILPMEMVQGLTYGGLWSVSAVYIQAPEEATKMIQSILHGVYWGVGMATGALVSGFVIEAYGVQNEFLVMSLLMAIICIVHLFILLFDRIQEMEESLQRKRDSGLDKLQSEKKEPDNFIGAAAAPLVPCLLYGR